MLYLTTRDSNDAYTVHKTMLSDQAPDGGVYIPFRLPTYSNTELNTLLEKTSGEIIADILNSFFSAKLSGWSVDLAIGRNGIKTVPLSQKVIAVETWKNPGYHYQYIENNLYKLLSDSAEISKTPTNWVRIAIRISMLFASYKSMIADSILCEDEGFDVSVAVNDFADGMAAWYGKNMGLPIETIICSTADHEAVWDLIHRGQINTATVSDNLCYGLDRLIYNLYGQDEANKFVQIAKEKKSYIVNHEAEMHLSDYFFCSVVGKGRADMVMSSLTRTDGYYLSAEAALVYGAIQDYRAKTGENRTTLLFSDQAPNK